ncbi:MAG: glycosyltransferase, partial [Lachnospiraceae bacterium]|nr:glycosyltransferase [Lachnospiraceae bacterium]
EKIHEMLKQPHDKERLSSDISFVGSLYHEQHNFYDRIDWTKNPYAEGYVKGLMDAQKRVNGYNFIEECLTPDILKQLQDLYPLVREEKSVETEGFRFADYVINRKLTSLERNEFLKAFGERFGQNYAVKLFTIDRDVTYDGVSNMGIAEYETEMPYVFYYSKINLNISLRSIKTGIPLRCMDIMASRGFLLTNYQSDFFIDFIPDEDFVYYESMEDALEKAEYYLSHEKEREAIAENGYRKVKEFFALKDVLNRMLAIAAKQNGGE